MTTAERAVPSETVGPPSIVTCMDPTSVHRCTLEGERADAMKRGRRRYPDSNEYGLRPREECAQWSHPWRTGWQFSSL